MKALLLPVILPMVEQVAMNALVSNKAPFMGKNKLGLGFMILSGLLLFVAIAFFIVSAYGWLLAQYAPPTAALVLASSILGVSMAMGVGGYFLVKKKPQPPVESDEITQILSMLQDVVGEEVMQPIKENPKTAVLLSSLAGFVTGDRLH